jgi:acetyltransferase-like isoleucine patch superfamily enzyme
MRVDRWPELEADRLRRLGADPDAALAALLEWSVSRGSGRSDPEHLRALQARAHDVRELDGGRALRELAARDPAAMPDARWGLRRSWRFAREHRMFTRMHARHALRLTRARLRIARSRADVELHGMSFLGSSVELTAPRGEGRLVVGPWCWIGDGVALRSHAGRVTVGPKSIIGGGTTINSYLDITIGEGVLIADDVHITDFDHRTDRLDVPIKDQGIVTAPVRIGPDVWLGRGVTVLRGVDIGRGSVIGAHAVVTRDIPPYSVAVGAPARVVRSRLSDGGS